MRANKRTILLLTIVLAVGVSAWVAAPEVVLTGTVIDDSTGDPISSVQVYIEGMNLGVLTERDGSYRLLVPRTRIAGDVVLKFNRIGYYTVDQIVTAEELSADVVTRDIRLHQEPLVLNEVVVSGAADATQRRQIGSAVDRAAKAPVGQGRVAGSPARAPGVREEAEASLRGPATRPDDRRDGRYRDYPSGTGSWSREQYDHITENDFRSVREEPLSTFSIDVDRASYSNVRRFLLQEHSLPPIDAVQIEEMINYFSYDYDLPEGDDPVGITTEVGVAPWNAAHRLLRVGLASKPIMTEDLPPSNLVFLLDVSGSMQSADKLPLVKQSLRLLVEQLRPQDRVAIVVYAGAAGLVLPPTSGARKDRIRDAIEDLEAGGSTAGGAGLRLAYRVAQDSFMPEGNNRVILATDGDFNVGESSDDAMVRLIEERRGEGVFLTVLGFGTGNLQSAKMQAIAQNGNGNYAYIDGLAEARKVFVAEMGGTLLTVAQDVKVQIEFNPSYVRQYRLLGYENRLLAPEDFNDDRKDAGDMGAGHRVTALYELVPVGGTDGRVDPLRYQDRPRPDDRARSEELAFVRVRYKAPRGTESRLVERPVGRDVGSPSNDFQFASAVAGFGMLLRHSEHVGAMTPERVLSLAREGLGADLDGYRHEFTDLVRAYQRITTHGRL